jgi:hypothetical protein
MSAVEFELEWVRPSLLICRLSGVATVEDCKALRQAVTSEPQFRPGISMIIVETNLDVSVLTASGVAQIADLRAQYAYVPPVRSVVVVGLDSPTRYGLARMFQAYAESQEDATIRVSETIDEAMGWLGEKDVPSPPESPSDGILDSL